MSATVQPQWMTAKARADEIRIKNSLTKKSIARAPQPEGFAAAARVLRQPTPEQEAMQVFGLLKSVRGVGEYAASTFLRRAGVLNPGKRVRDLTARQRGLIADWLEFEAERREFERRAA